MDAEAQQPEPAEPTARKQRNPVLAALAGWLPTASRSKHPISEESASSRAEAYIYGNVLELAALATVNSHEVLTGEAMILVGGTAVAAFVAHVLAATFGHSVKRAASAPPGHLRTRIRDAVPIATSGALPAIVLLLGFVSFLPAQVALVIAICIFILRFLLLGPMISYLESERLSWKVFGTGVVLAVAGVGVALLEILLTH